MLVKSVAMSFFACFLGFSRCSMSAATGAHVCADWELDQVSYIWYIWLMSSSVKFFASISSMNSAAISSVSLSLVL